VEFKILLTQPHILDSLVELSNGYEDPNGTGGLDDQDESGGFDDQDGSSGPDDLTRSGELEDPHGSGRSDDLDVLVGSKTKTCRVDSMTPNDLGMPD